MRPSVLVLLAFALTLPSVAQVTGISYTAAPVGVRVFSGDNTGLSNGYLYGGALGLGFGEYLEVSGVYLRSTGFTTEFSDYDTDAFTGSILEGQAEGFDVDLEQYGYASPLDGGARKSVTLHRRRYRHFAVRQWVERFRVDLRRSGRRHHIRLPRPLHDYCRRVARGLPVQSLRDVRSGNTAALPTTSDLNQIRRVYSNAVTATARIYLGGRARGELTETDLAVREQLRRPRVFAEPSYGIIQFSEDLTGLPDEQPVAGIQAGIDLGPYVGLRGFYLRATDEDELFSNPTEFRDLALMGPR